MFKFLAGFIGSVVVFIVLSLITLVLMEVALDAVVRFVLWTAEVMGIEYK